MMTESELRNIFGNTLGRAMAEKEISQVALAKTIGVSRMTVANWLAGRNTPDLFRTYLVSKVLNISIEKLIGGECVNVYKEIIWQLETINKTIKSAMGENENEEPGD